MSQTTSVASTQTVPTRVAYQGVPGCYSFAAVHRFFSGDSVEAISKHDFRSVFQSIVSGEVDYGMIPIENNLGGSIHTNYDYLQKFDVEIVAEHNFHIDHCLVATQPYTLERLAKFPKVEVYSHPQALEQCRERLHGWGFTPCEYYDTAAAAVHIQQMEGAFSSANTIRLALCSRQAATLNNLDIISSGVADHPDNYTRFLTLKRVLVTKRVVHQPLTHPTKTSVVFSLKNSVGALGKVLSIFSLYDVDLTKIESRPNSRSPLERGADTPFHYMFTLEFLENRDSPAGKHCLDTLSTLSSYSKCLGSYPVDNTLYRDLEKLRIGIVGGGPFGQYMANYLVHRIDPAPRRNGSPHSVSMYSRSDYSRECKEMGIPFYPSLEEFLSSPLDVIVICVSMAAFEPVLRAMQETGQLQHQLLVDVLSVKGLPAKVFQELTPASCDLLLTHPMFGPQSYPGIDWTGAPFVYHEKRIVETDRCRRFLALFDTCRLIPMSPEQHDHITARSQFLAHLVGRIMKQLNIIETPIDTTSFRHLIALKKIVEGDSDALFRGLYNHNPHSPEILTVMERKFKEICEVLR